MNKLQAIFVLSITIIAMIFFTWILVTFAETSLMDALLICFAALAFIALITTIIIVIFEVYERLGDYVR